MSKKDLKVGVEEVNDDIKSLLPSAHKFGINQFHRRNNSTIEGISQAFKSNRAASTIRGKNVALELDQLADTIPRTGRNINNLMTSP